MQSRAFNLSSIHLSNQSYYEDLGVHPQSSSKEVKDAFYKLSKEFHPDRNVDNPSALKKFQNISEAYDTLSNPSKRTKYDKGVLGRSSSVAEREAATHRFEGETFYGNRSSRMNQGESDPGKNLDSWVKDHRKQTFETSQYYKKMMKGKLEKHERFRGKSMHDRRLGGGSSITNQKTDKGIGFLLLVIIFLVIVIRSVV